MKNTTTLPSLISQLHDALKTLTLSNDLPQDLVETVTNCYQLSMKMEEISIETQAALNKALFMQRTIINSMHLENNELNEKELLDLKYNHNRNSAFAYILLDYLCKMSEYTKESETILWQQK